MPARSPDERPDPPTTAVVQVTDDGTGTLYLGTELVEHAAGVKASTVMSVLVDYAASIKASVRVTTQMPDGTWTRHRLDPDGTITQLPRNLEPAMTPAGSTRSTEPRRPAARARVRGRAMARVLLMSTLVLLVAVSIVVLATT